MSSTNSVVTLFGFTRLRELKKHCASASLTRSDLANYILWCKTPRSPFLHFPCHRSFTPGHLHLSDTDLAALASNGVGKMKPSAQKAANKIYATFEERRMLSGHLFQGVWQWHFIYFDNRDTDRHKNHWKGGPHLHLINWLMPNRTPEDVWKQFRTGTPNMKGALHLRFCQ